MFRKMMIAAVVAPLALTPAWAQDSDEVIKESQGSSEVRGDWVLGARVTSPDGESIGSIEDLILDMEGGSVTAAVVSVGGFLGFGSKEIAVDWSELEIDYDGNEITLAITREEAEEAEEYIFRDRESAPQPEPADGTGMGTGTGTGTGTGGGMGTGGTTTQ